MPPKTPPTPSKENRTKARSAAHTPEEVLKNAVEELTARMQTLEQAKNAAEESRNYTQLERDKLESFWNIAKGEVGELQASLRNKDREAEEAEDRHQIEIKVYKQKVKHLLYEHQNNLAAMKIETEVAVKEAVEQCHIQQQGLVEDKVRLKQQLRDQTASGEEALARARLEAAKELSMVKVEMAGTSKDLAATYDSKLGSMREEGDARRKAEVQAIEDAKAAEIQSLVKEHGKAYEEMRSYFNDITANTLDLIKALKADAAELKRRETAAEALAFELAQENKRLIDPLALAQKQAEEMRTRTKGYETSLAQLKTNRGRLASAEQQITSLEWKNEVLEQQLQVLESQNRSLRPGAISQTLKHIAAAGQ